MPDGSISFSTDLENKDVEKKLKQVERDIHQTQKRIENYKEAKLPLTEELKELHAEIKKATLALGELEEKQNAVDLAMTQHDPSNPLQYTDAVERKPGIDAEVSKQQETVDALVAKWDKLNAKVEAYDRKIRAANATLTSQKVRAGALSAQQTKGGKDMTAAMNKATKAAAGFQNKIKGIVSRVFIFSLLSRALTKIVSYFNKVAKTNKEFNSQLSKLKGALLTAFQPIFETIMPALISLMKVATYVVQAVGHVFSLLGGKSSSESAKSAQSLNEEAEAIDAVGSSAKKASKSLAGFDQINQLSSNDSSSSGVSSSTATPDFSEFDTADYKAKINEITVYVSGALLALGAILTFTGVNIPLGIGLLAVGAIGLVTEIATNWNCMSTELQKAITTVLVVLAAAALVIGAILTFTGVNIPLGIGLMIAGAAMLGAAVAVNWNTIKKALKGPIGAVTALVGTALLAVGAILTFSGANLPLGIGLMVAGAALVATVAALNWNTIKEALQGPIGVITALVGTALLAVGAILTFSGANLPLGIGLMVAGAALVATVAALNWNTIKEALRGPIGKIVALISGVLLVIGVILCFTGVGIPLGIALIAAGAIGLVTVIAINWNAIVTTVKNVFNKVSGWIQSHGFVMLILGIVMLFSGVGVPIGLALIGLGLKGMVSGKDPLWNVILNKIKEVWAKIKTFWNNNIAKFFTAKWWGDLAKNAINGFLKWIFNGLNKLISKLNTFGFKLPDVLGGGRVGFNIAPLKVPQLAQGAVLPPNKPFMAVVGDQKHGTNVEAPLDTIKQALSEVMANQTIGDININFIGELAQLARILKPVIEKEERRVGGSMVKKVGT